MMFALNEGYQWKSTRHADNLHGVVYLAQGNNAERMRRKPMADFAWQIFDPQLYLSSLTGADSAVVCARLATYPWFAVPGVPAFDSGESGQIEWQQAVQRHVRENWPGRPPIDAAIPDAAFSAIQFQVDLGCTHLLAATPMIEEREDEGDTTGQWLDAALEAAARMDVGQPVIATVAVTEGVLNEDSFAEGGFLDTIVDQVTAREGLSGVYIVVDQTQSRHPLCASVEVTRTYAHLTRAFANFGYEHVFVNFADVFGLVCVGLGASGFATGPSQAMRRLCLASIADDGGGLPLPHFYSHRVVAEFLPVRELGVIAVRRLLRRVEDNTIHSRDLFRALNAGRSADSVAEWAESKNNVSKAAQHFIEKMIQESVAYSSITPEERYARAETWLEDADADQVYLRDRLEGHLQSSPTYAPVNAWLDQLTM